MTQWANCSRRRVVYAAKWDMSIRMNRAEFAQAKRRLWRARHHTVLAVAYGATAGLILDVTVALIWWTK